MRDISYIRVEVSAFCENNIVVLFSCNNFTILKLFDSLQIKMTWINTVLVVNAIMLMMTASAYKILPSLLRMRSICSSLSDDDKKDFDEALKSLGPVWDRKLNEKDSEVYDKIRKNQEEKAEEIYRKYPFEEVSLPILPDCNNYYSGKFGDYFWHQNSDQVYVYIPIDDSVLKGDIHIKFEARNVEVKVHDEKLISFQCLERIIPDGSFWIIEQDQAGKRYLQLDLEKRFRMINWKSLFGEAVEEDVHNIEARAKMMEKLFAANKGMSRLTGVPAETISEINEEYFNKISAPVDSQPTIFGEMEDGTKSNFGKGFNDDDDDDDDELSFDDLKVVDTEAVNE